MALLRPVLVLALVSGALAVATIPKCSSNVKPDCPTSERFVYCQDGPMAQFCRPNVVGRWSLDECKQQCVYGEDKPVGECAYGEGRDCPANGSHYYCRSGSVKGECRAVEMGPIPKTRCESQCVYDSRNPPRECPGTIGINSPKDGPYYYCRDGPKAQEWRPAAQNPFPISECTLQCTFDATLPPRHCPSGVGNQCSQDETSYYCRGGPLRQQCKDIDKGPFGEKECYKSCTYNVNNPLRWCPDGTGSGCPTQNKWYWCEDGDHEATCRALAHGPFTALECKKQCVYTPGDNVAEECAPAVGDECPKNGKYWYCKAGKAKNGCRLESLGKFPEEDCAKQCLYGSFVPPLVCSGNDGSDCPRDGDYYYCQTGSSEGKCRSLRKGPWDNTKCLMQCVHKPSQELGYCAPGVGISCPRTGTYFYCRAGQSVHGCRPASSGLWPAVDCADACIYSADMIRVRDCKAGVGSTACPLDGGFHYFCSEGAAEGKCQPVALAPYADTECKKQCVFKG